MPIIPSIELVQISQEAFGKMAFEVMRHVFSIHDEYGRFFDEIVYKKELLRRLCGIELEVAVNVVHESFSKTFFADVIANRSGLFEFKAAEKIHAKHRAQTTHYLLLFGLQHAKIINTRPEKVEHEFVNFQVNLAELRNPSIVDAVYQPDSPGARELREILLGLIQDWGAGLDLSLYEEAVTHFLGGESNVLCRVPVNGTGGVIAQQQMRLVTPDTAFKLTAFSPSSPSQEQFRTHALRLLKNTPLSNIQWINIHQTQITFNTLHRSREG
ncbi:GxxExxY protein [Pirellulaceae bacterium SH449]